MVINFSSYSRYLLSILIHFLFFLILLIPKYQNDALHNKKTIEFNINFLKKKKDIVQQEAYVKDKKSEKKKKKIADQNIQKNSSVKKEEEKKLVTKDNILENNNTKSENNPIQTGSNLINNIKKNENIDSKSNALESINDHNNNKSSIDEIGPEVNEVAREYQSVISKKSNSQSIDKTQKKEAFNNYNNYLIKSIQTEASKNYPRRSIRNNEEGKVVLIFSLDKNGFLKEISIGEKTAAPKRLVEAAKKTLEKLSPFKKNTILTNYNVFSIAIVYKLN